MEFQSSYEVCHHFMKLENTLEFLNSWKKSTFAKKKRLKAKKVPLLSDPTFFMSGRLVEPYLSTYQIQALIFAHTL